MAEAYHGTAQQLLRRYGHEMLYSDLENSVPEERNAVAAFAKIVRRCATDFLASPCFPHSLPAWNLVERELPGFGERLIEAADGGHGNR